MGYKDIEDRKAYHRKYYAEHRTKMQTECRGRQRKYRKANPDSGKAYARRVKDAAFGAYGGYICACCSETTKAFLTLDHINNDGHLHRKAGIRGKGLYGWIKTNDFPPIFQVLCFNCNCGRSINNGICPHKDR